MSPPPGTLFALLGDPVHHSLSPALQNAAFRAAEVEAIYVAIRTFPELVGPLMRELAVAGGGGNVTLPHKGRAAAALDRATAAVRATNACNCFWWEESRGLCGDNTDVEGFVRAAESLLGTGLADARVLVLGAGGAARGVVHACVQAGAGRIDILNRTVARAETMIQGLGSPPPARLLRGGEAPRSDRYDLVVNATSLGLTASDPLPLDPERIACTALLDLVYSRDETALVKAARAAGIRAEDGRRMLVEQAAASFRRWLGIDAPLAVMARAVGLANVE